MCFPSLVLSFRQCLWKESIFYNAYQKEKDNKEKTSFGDRGKYAETKITIFTDEDLWYRHES